MLIDSAGFELKLYNRLNRSTFVAFFELQSF